MKSLENLISLFDSEKFFFMTTFLPVMLYKDFSETQRISIFYIIFWSFPMYQKYIKPAQSIPVVYIILLFIIITFLSLEILTFDVPKLSLITNIMHKILDYIFIRFSQYGVIYIILSIVILEIKTEIIIIFSIFFLLKGAFELLDAREVLRIFLNLFDFKQRNITMITIVYACKVYFLYIIEFILSVLIYCNMTIDKQFIFFCSTSLFIIGIFIISCENFKIKTVTEFFKYIPPPVKTDENIFPLDCIYDIKFFEWMDKINKEKNYEYYDIIYGFLNKKKAEIYEKKDKYLGINHMQIVLIRSLGMSYGRENLIRLHFFGTIYAVLYLKNLRKFFEKKYGPFYSEIYFRNYLLKICIKNLTLNFSEEIKYSSIFKYMGERKENWSKEKFFVGCLGIRTKIKDEKDILEIFNDSRYIKIIRKYNLSKNKIERYLYQIVSNE